MKKNFLIDGKERRSFLFGFLGSILTFFGCFLFKKEYGLWDNTDNIKSSKKERVSVFDFGAKGDGVTDDTAAIQAAINSLSNGGEIEIPFGTFIVSNNLLVSTNFINIKGSGRGSVLKNTRNTSTLSFENCERISITELALLGNGGAKGVRATNSHGIDISNSHHIKLTNVYIEYNSGHGIYSHNGQWNLYLSGCYIMNNALDGINSLTNTTQANSGQNGNAMSIVNSVIGYNAGNGISWTAASLNITGSTFEGNKKAGICIDTKSAWASAYGINIKGNYFESNHFGQIQLISSLAENGKPARTVTGATIEGNWLYSNYAGTDGATALIDSQSGGYYSSIQNSNIGYNGYSIAGSKLTDYVSIDSSQNSVTVQSTTSRNYFSVSGEAKIINPRRTKLVSGYTQQKGITFTNPFRSDNFLSQSPKSCYYALPAEEDLFIRTIRFFIETDASSNYTATLTLYSADATGANALANIGQTTITAKTSNFIFEWQPLLRVDRNHSYYLQINIASVTGGTYMYMRDLILEID